MGKLRIALGLSIVLNLFLAAALAAGYVTLRDPGRMIAAGSLRVAGSELPAGQRRSFRQSLREARRAMHATVLASRAAKAQAAELLRRPVVDQAAVMAALDHARAADMAVRAAVERRAVAFAASLPPADRSTLADALKRRAARGQPGTE